MIVRLRFSPHPFLDDESTLDRSDHTWCDHHPQDVLMELPAIPRAGEWLWLDIDQPELPENGGTWGRYLVRQVIWMVTRDMTEPWLLIENIS